MAAKLATVKRLFVLTVNGGTAVTVNAAVVP
jgi:hypothetical protein